MAASSEFIVAPAGLVTIALFSAATGISADAVRNNIARGVWMQGREYVRAPNDRIYMDMEGFYKWARGERKAA